MGSETPWLLFSGHISGIVTPREPAQLCVGNGSVMCDPVFLMGPLSRCERKRFTQKGEILLLTPSSQQVTSLPQNCPGKPTEWALYPVVTIEYLGCDP